MRNSLFRNGSSLLFLVCLTLQCLACTARAEGVTVEFATSALVDSSYRVNAYIKYDFDDEVLTALTHGVSLRIDTYIRVKRKRKWLWDPLVRDETISFLLQRHALSNDYLVTNLNSKQKQQFRYLDEALRYLGLIKDHFLFDKSTIDLHATYVGYIKAELNVEALPPPLRPIAYISPHWQAESPWFEWQVK